MKKTLLLALPLLLWPSCDPKPEETSELEESSWESLWNDQDLQGWHTYLGTPENTSEVPEFEKDSTGNYRQKIGIDHDPVSVFSVTEIDGIPAIRITGEVFGMIYSEKSYSNYHLKLKVKWGEEKYPPRTDQRRDSGLLYHGFGEPGSAYAWMPSQELQIQEGDMGDYWPVGAVEIDIPSKPLDSTYYQYDPASDLRTYYFAEIVDPGSQDSLAKRRCFKALDAEKPHGQWNDVELICYGDSSIHIVNGAIVMRLYNSKNVAGDQPKSLKSGKIILQSEGAEVYYKDISIKSITGIDPVYLEP